MDHEKTPGRPQSSNAPSGGQIDSDRAGKNHYSADILWQRGEQDFCAGRYSRAHRLRFDGGLDIAGSSSPHVVPLPWSDPAALDPEEAFVSSIASCHMLWFLALAAQDGWCVDCYRDNAEGEMRRNAQGKLFVGRVTLRPAVLFSGPDQPATQALASLHHRAHEECFIANSVLTEVICEPVLPTRSMDTIPAASHRVL